MSKKDYVRLAELIKRNGNPARADIMALPFIEGLCEMLKADNPRFDEARFKVSSGFAGMFSED